MEVDIVTENVHSTEKCGIQLNPTSFVIIYRSHEKLKKKVMPLRNFMPSSNVELIARDLKKRHNLNDVPLVKIEKMLRLLQELQIGTCKSEAVEVIKKECEIKINEDLNKLSTHEIELQKQLMDSLFVKNQIKKDDKDFEYDKRIDFSGEKKENDWDLEEDNFWNKT